MTEFYLPGKAADHAVSRLIGVRDVLELTSFSRGTLYRLIRDNRFPVPLQIGKRRVAWREAQVRDWIESQTAVRWAA